MQDDVADLIRAAGVGGRPLREAVVQLTEDPAPDLSSLIGATALPRRIVEELLAAVGEDLVRDGAKLGIRPAHAESYRHRFADPPTERGPLIATMAAYIKAAPPPLPGWDHVAATPETVAARAWWLDGTFDLAGAHVLCVGDHDLTSLALRAVNQDVTVTVVDVDERVLEYLDQHGIRCLYGDLRLGLPPEATEVADLVFTDPPYTPEGVSLFLTRGLQGLRDREHGRLMLAYGYGPHQPALGLKVQQAIGRLQVAIAAILPQFNRYDGAEAIGGHSDLYVLQPTAGTWKNLEQGPLTIYTHGSQSVEASVPALDGQVAAALLQAAAGPEKLKVALVIGESDLDGRPHMGLGPLMRHGIPANMAPRTPFAVALDLSADPGPWLARALLATNATRLAILVPNAHPDLVSEAAQRALTDLVSAKYALRLRRSFPESRYAVVEATATAGSTAAGLVLERAHGKVANSWREGLIREGRVATKNEARAVIGGTARRPELLDTSPMSLPRHQLVDLIGQLTDG